jgi:phosphate-transporting ATPase
MLSVHDLTRPGLSPVSFELAAGECIAVLGPSGAGKSLLLRSLADLDPNSGTVTFNGASRESIPGPEWRRQVTYVASEPGWWAATVKPHYRNWTEAVELAASLGLSPECGTWAISRLSTGERQRLGLVRALVQRPEVLLLDEPTSGLDEAAHLKVEQIIAKALEQGAAALWVTHDLSQAKRVAARTLRIENGAVQEDSA